MVTVSVDTITLTTQPYQCHVEVTPSEFTTVSDNCNQEVTYLSGGETIDLPIGYHEVVVAASDLCQNVASEVIVFHVVEATPPVAVLHDILTLNFASDTSVTDHFITAAAYDVGSHDSQCGPVTIEIARKSEVDMTEFNGGDPSNVAMFHCTDFTSVDSNEDGVVSLDELFRERVDICCSDIGRTISLYVLITDESGNETRAEVRLEVNTKLEWRPCDDGDPCTTDDKSYGECGCGGVPIVSDVDGDDLVDCIDDEIIICLEGENLEISFSEIDSFLQLGAVGGPCDNDETAIIAGEIITPLGEPIEAVEVYANEEIIDMTSDVGTYALPPQEMYKRYELLPLKDDDPLNGVSAVDMVMLQEYILGLRSINDPYLLIAADVNGDGKVSATDVVDMQRILLGNRNNWKGNRSWRFVIEILNGRIFASLGLSKR